MLKLKDMLGGSYNAFIDICINPDIKSIEAINFINHKCREVVLQAIGKQLDADLIINLFDYYSGQNERSWYSELIKCVTPFVIAFRPSDIDSCLLKSGLSGFIELCENNANFNFSMTNLFKMNFEVTDIQYLDKISKSKLSMSTDRDRERKIVREFMKVVKLPSILFNNIMALKTNYATEKVFLEVLGRNLSDIFPYDLIDFMDSEFDY